MTDFNSTTEFSYRTLAGIQVIGSPKVGDCICTDWLPVAPSDTYWHVARSDLRSIAVFCVFSNKGDFLGLVEVRKAAIYPDKYFSELLSRRWTPPLSADTDIQAALHLLSDEFVGQLPCVRADGKFVGVVSLPSIIAALIGRERGLRAERERMIAKLRCELENREVMARVFDATGESIMVTDAEQRILLVNRAFTEVTGYGEEEAIGKTPELLKSGRHGREFYAAMWRALSEKDAWEGEVWNRRKNGELYPEWLHIIAVRDDKGAVRYYAGVFSDVTKHQDLRNKLLHLAYYDVLTDLPNRQLFNDRLQQAITQARRSSGGFSLLFVDLDRFKDINDTLGHRFGDQILIAVAERLQGAVRASDTVARLGGDEFILLLQDTSRPEGIAEIAEKILVALSAPLAVEGKTLFVGGSIGVSRYPDDGDDGDTLLMNADAAMYRAKESGRGRFNFYSRDMNSLLGRRIEISGALRQSLAAGRLWLAWQPQVGLPDGRIVGAEALARWEGPGGVPVSPAEFIPIAEETGLIDALGAWAMRAACEQGARLAHHACDGFRLAVNFSPLQLNRHSQRTILDIVSVSGLDPRRLEIELTETALSARREDMLGFLTVLGRAGVEVSVDDFGTGCSNLATLKLLPIHKLKIDRSFVSDLATDPNDRQIAAAIIGMAHALGLKVLAEGVETAEQAEILANLGCDMAQGFYFSPPVPFEALERLIKQNKLPAGFPTK